MIGCAVDENAFRPTVLQALKPLHGVFVENVMLAGTPDINYVEGWIELKWLEDWPKKPQTPVRLPKFKRGQRIFLYKRCLAGGQAYLLLRVNLEWILLPGFWAATRLGTATRAEIIAAAWQHWPRRLMAAELVAFLRTNPPMPIATLSLLPGKDAIFSASGRG